MVSSNRLRTGIAGFLVAADLALAATPVSAVLITGYDDKDDSVCNLTQDTAAAIARHLKPNPADWDNYKLQVKAWVVAHCKNGQLLMMGDWRGVYGINEHLSNIANTFCRGADIQETPRPDRSQWAYEVKCPITKLSGPDEDGKR